MPASSSARASFSGVWPPNCTMTPCSVPFWRLGLEDLQHVLGGQRLEIEPVGGVVVGRDGLRVAVDHDGLVAGILEREAGVAAAIVELDALADAVRAAAEDDDLLGGRWAAPRRPARPRRAPRRSSTCRRSARRTRPRRCRCACRPGARRASGAALRTSASVEPVEDREPRIGEAHRLELAEGARRRGQAVRLHLGFEVDDRLQLLEEPAVDLAAVVDLVMADAEAHRLRDLQQPVRRRRAERRLDGVLVVALAEALDLDLVEAR